MEENLTGKPLCAENKKAAQENFLRCFCSRVGFGAGFLKNEENRQNERIVDFDGKNTEKQRKRPEIN